MALSSILWYDSIKDVRESWHGREDKSQRERQTIAKLTNRITSIAHHVLPNHICPNTMHDTVRWNTPHNMRCCVCQRPLSPHVVLRKGIMPTDAAREVMRECHHIASHRSPWKLTICLGHRECCAVRSMIR